MITRFVTGLAIAGVLCLADVQYEETARITGGSLTRIPFVGGRMKEPSTTTHLLKGNKMSTITKSKDTSIQTIIDLDKETFTNVDHSKRQYSVLTFDEMRQAMEKMFEQMRQMNPEAQKQKGEMDVQVKVTDGNENKTVSGLDAHKWIVDIDMVAQGQNTGTRIHTEYWVSKEFPGHKEMAAFQKRMAEKIGYGMVSNINPMARAQMGKGFEKLAEEMAKMEGHPVATFMRMGKIVDGKEEMISQSQANSSVDVKGAAGDAAADTASREASSRASSRMGGFGGLASSGIGGLGGLRRKKKEEQQQKQQEQQAAEVASGATVANSMIESTSELVSVSKASVDGSQLEVPAGFKQVDSEMKRYLKK